MFYEEKVLFANFKGGVNKAFMLLFLTTISRGLTLFMMGFFGVAHGWEEDKKTLLTKICHTYPTYGTPFGFCNISIFSLYAKINFLLLQNF